MMKICIAGLQTQRCRWKNKFVKYKWKTVLFCVLSVLCISAFFAAKHDAAWYSEPVAEITQIQTRQIGCGQSTRGTPEEIYEQSIQARLLNGEDAGKIIELKNRYGYTQMKSEKYHKGDQVFPVTSDGEIQHEIRGRKRDDQIVFLIGAAVLFLLFFMGKQGVLTIFTIVINSVVFAIGFQCFMHGKDIIGICNKMVVVFAVVTLLLLNGFHKKTWAAIASTLCVVGLIMVVFESVVHITGEIDYSTVEYLGSIETPDTVFRAEILLSGLGAIMDVAIVMTSGLDELIRKNPSLSLREFLHSGREIGYDIMGTMLNVLLFVFGSSLIPTFLVRMNNGVSMFTVIEQHISCEVYRFLIESIGIVLAIPVSVFCSVLFLRVQFFRRLRKC